MGKGRRERPRRLGAKLSAIRQSFGLSQNAMLHHLGLNDKLTREEISAYERGVREPTLLTLLRYARAAGVYVDALIDDEASLPERLPAQPKSEGIIKARSKKRQK